MNEVATARPKAVLFDWDNTLVDSWDTIHDSMNTTLAHMGHDLWTADQTHERVRKSLREAFPELFGDRWEEARDVFYARFREIHLQTLRVKDGAEAALSAFAGEGIYLGVVSNKSGDHLRAESAHLDWNRFFGRVIGATDAERDKPAVDPVLMALEPAGIAPGPDVWFVGDTNIDMECARNAGCVGVLVGKDADSVDFGDHNPDIRLADCIRLAGLVERF